MKKIFLVLFGVMALYMASCSSNGATKGGDADSVAVDSDSVSVDSLAGDSVHAMLDSISCVE